MKKLLYVFALVFLVQACAAQAQVGLQPTSLVGGSNGFSVIEGADDTLTTKGFAFYDSTGIVLASLTNAGHVQHEREKAAASAAPGETFTFSVDMVAPTPGLWTKFEYIKGKSDVMEYVQKDVRMTFHTLFLGDDAQYDNPRRQPQIAFGLGVFQTSLTTPQFGGNTEDAFALPLSMTYTQTVPGMSNLRGSVGGGLDTIAPIFGTFGYEGTGRIDFLIFPWLSLYVAVTHRRAPADLGDTIIKINSADLGITAYYF